VCLLAPISASSLSWVLLRRHRNATMATAGVALPAEDTGSFRKDESALQATEALVMAG